MPGVLHSVSRKNRDVLQSNKKITTAGRRVRDDSTAPARHGVRPQPGEELPGNCSTPGQGSGARAAAVWHPAGKTKWPVLSRPAVSQLPTTTAAPPRGEAGCVLVTSSSGILSGEKPGEQEEQRPAPRGEAAACRERRVTRGAAHLLMSGILVLQLLKDPEMKTSLPPSAQRMTVGRACWDGFTDSSRSGCHDTNSLSPGI